MLITGFGRTPWEAEMDARHRVAMLHLAHAAGEELGRLLGPLIGHLLHVVVSLVLVMFRPVTLVLWCGYLLLAMGVMLGVGLAVRSWGPAIMGAQVSSGVEVAVVCFAGLAAFGYVLGAPGQIQEFDRMDLAFSGFWWRSKAWKVVLLAVGVACTAFTLYLVLSLGMALTWWWARVPVARWVVLPPDVVLHPWMLWGASPWVVVAGIWGALAAAGHRMQLAQAARGF